MTYDRRAIMLDAHRRYRRRVGTTHEIPFAEALRRAWESARLRRHAVNEFHEQWARGRKTIREPFPLEVRA